MYYHCPICWMASLNANEINDGDIFFERKIRDVTEGLDERHRDIENEKM